MSMMVIDCGKYQITALGVATDFGPGVIGKGNIFPAVTGRHGAQNRFGCCTGHYERRFQAGTGRG